jgi:GNAT superfamily N-acetyltransferase
MNIRIATEADFSQWLLLWKGYQVFYKADIDESTTETTWSRFHNVAELRAKGVGRALIQHVYAAAADAGASRVYWLTHDSNSDAMLLYDRIADKTGFIQYRKLI